LLLLFLLLLLLLSLVTVGMTPSLSSPSVRIGGGGDWSAFEYDGVVRVVVAFVVVTGRLGLNRCEDDDDGGGCCFRVMERHVSDRPTTVLEERYNGMVANVVHAFAVLVEEGIPLGP
jgi:hypothetical protein